jgi:hypothetical protein
MYTFYYMSSARNFTNLWSNLCTRKGVCGVGGIRTSNQLTLSQVLTDSSDCILVRRSAVNALGTCCFCLGNFGVFDRSSCDGGRRIDLGGEPYWHGICYRDSRNRLNWNLGWDFCRERETKELAHANLDCVHLVGKLN